MSHLFPPLLPKDALRPPVLVLAAHPDDEVIACGGMLAWHRERGDAVVVAHLTAGAQGDPDAKFGDIAAVRRREGREALRRLGVLDLRGYDLPDGQLPEHFDAVVATVRELFEQVRPQTLYSFFFTEAHRDHRAVASACARAADSLPRGCRCLLFGVNQVVVGGSMFDVGAFMDRKQHALAAFESQLAYNDFATKILHRDHAATVNVEDRAVQYAELFADLRPADLAGALGLADPLYRFLLGER